jgi:hypothetical protein
VRKASFTLLAFLMVVAFSSGPATSTAAESIAIPTTVTINKGKLIDDYPGSRPHGITDLSMPFYGQISVPNPACQVPRPYELGRVEEGKFVSMGFWVRSTAPAATGKWVSGLTGIPPRPMAVAVRVPPKTTVSSGVSYRCEEAISSTVQFDKNDFTPCLLARAEQRGYPLAIRQTKQELRRAEVAGWDDLAAAWRQRLRDFRARHDDIKRAVESRC